MKKIVCLVILTLCLCQFGLAQPRIQDVQLERVKDTIFVVKNGKRYVANKDVVTVKLRSGVNKMRDDFKASRFNRLGYVDLSVPEGVDIEDYASMLKKTGDFDVVEYNSIGEYCVTPNDTHLNEQWYLNSINAYSAWDIIAGNPNIRVAVLDSGTDWTHSDIGNGTDGYSNIDATLGWNYITNNANVITTNEHGTRVAGIVGAKTNNSRGIAGVTGGNHSSGVTIIPMCVGVDAPNSAILDDAILDAVDKGARVIQMSLDVGYTLAIDDAIVYATDNNVVVVCASGNDPYDYGLPVSFPASHDDVIAVGAINSNNVRANFSNYGSKLDVVAPGVNVLSTTLYNNYNSGNGTSFAAPQVAGIAALILSVRPDLSAVQVRNTIESTCAKINQGTGSDKYNYTTTSGRPNGIWHSQVGYGMVNAYEAVYSVAPRINGPSSATRWSSVTFSITNPSISYTWNKSNNLSLVSASGSSAQFTCIDFGEAWVSLVVNGIEIARKTFIVNANTTISGPDQICDEGTYTLNNLPTGATINWGSTGSGGLGRVLSLVSGQGTPTAVFRKIFPGNHTIYADITIGGITARAEKNNIATGTPSMPSSWMDNITPSYSTPGYVTYPVCFSSLGPYPSYYIQFFDQGYSSMPYLGYDVEDVSGTNVQVVKGLNCLKITPTRLGTKVIRVRAHNACGESDPLQITINVQDCLPGPGGPGTDPITLSCYPNPADDVLNVSIEEETQLLSSSRSFADKPVYTIRLWSGIRGLVRTVEAQQGAVTQISLQGLPSGLYFVHIIKDGEILRKQIIQKR